MNTYQGYIKYAFYFLLSYIIIYHNNDIIFKHKNSEQDLDLHYKKKLNNIELTTKNIDETDNELDWGQFEDIEIN